MKQNMDPATPQEMDGKELTKQLVSRYRTIIEELQNKLAEKEAAEMKRNEAMSLKKDPFYGDMENVEDKVLAYAEKYGVSLKEAYGALYGESKAKESEEKARLAKKKISALSQEGNHSDEFEEGVLSRDEHWAAKQAGMSLADYLKYKTMDR